MVSFGLLTNPSKDILSEIRRAKKLGLDYVEIGIEGPLGMPEILVKKKKQILNLLTKQGMPAIGHTAWWMHLGSPYPEVRKGWIKEAKKALRAANKINIKLLNFHAHSSGMFLMLKNEKKKVLDNYVSSMKEMVSYGKKFGVKVMLENAGENKEITRVSDIKYILDRVKGLGFHLDVGHANIWGNPLKFINTFRKKIVHVHFHDNHGLKDEHLPIGEGDIDYKKVVQALKKTGYDGTITFEVFHGGVRGFRESVNKIKKLWKSV